MNTIGTKRERQQALRAVAQIERKFGKLGLWALRKYLALRVARARAAKQVKALRAEIRRLEGK